MKVEYLQDAAGIPAGTVKDISKDKLAKALIDLGVAKEYVEKAKKGKADSEDKKGE